MLKYFDITR